MKTLAHKLALAALVFASLAVAGPLDMEGLWIREAPPGARVMVGYGRFTNSSSEVWVLTGANSEHFGAVEIHRTIIREGIARMAPQSRLAIKPGESLVLEPNSYHFMLFDPGKPLRAGDAVTLQLHFEGGASQEITLQVRSAMQRNP